MAAMMTTTTTCGATNASAFSMAIADGVDDDVTTTTTTMKRTASVARSIDELLARSPRARDVERERAESFSTHASSDRSSIDGFAMLGARSTAREDVGDEEDAARGGDDRSRARGGEEYFTSFDSPRREVTLREVCAVRAAEGAIAPDGAGVLVDVCRGMLARERVAHGAFVLDTTRALHVEYRAQLIEWVLDVCAGERFAPATADVAIALMDRVLSKTLVPKTSLHLVALCCLQIAIKYEEIEERVPTMAKLRSWTSNMYSPDIIQKMELAVLIELKWDVGALTPAHFLESFLAVTGGGTTARDEVEFGEWNTSYREDLRQFVCYVYSLCVMDPSLTNERPSRVAAAVIGAVRLNLGIKPMCSPELRAAADLQPQEIVPLVSHILRLYSEACSDEGDDMDMDCYAGGGNADAAGMSIAIPEKDGFERVTENASPTCPLDMHWEDC